MVNLIRPFLQFISEFDSESIIKIGPYVAIVKNKSVTYFTDLRCRTIIIGSLG